MTEEQRPWAIRAGALAMALVLLGAVTVLRGQAAAGDLPSQVRIFLVVPADGDLDYGLADAARHETGLAMSWLESEVGRPLDRGVDFAEIIRLPAPAAAFAGLGADAHLSLLDAVRAHVADDRVFPIVLADVRTDLLDAHLLTCGQGSPNGLVVYLGNCTHRHLSATSVWGSPASITLAHELVHGLGAVGACGRSTSPDGHVTDDPTDVLRSGLDGPRGLPVTLDAGGDDYRGHGIRGCPDILDSPLWR